MLMRDASLHNRSRFFYRSIKFESVFCASKGASRKCSFRGRAKSLQDARCGFIGEKLARNLGKECFETWTSWRVTTVSLVVQRVARGKPNGTHTVEGRLPCVPVVGEIGLLIWSVPRAVRTGTRGCRLRKASFGRGALAMLGSAGRAYGGVLECFLPIGRCGRRCIPRTRSESVSRRKIILLREVNAVMRGALCDFPQA